ncbi:hypothetical protein [Orrella sp. 11846]|uniref:hypothetical protein n=1 Tax=Orrella sp. 11846 TaxID=3409913 RepID=UPI003B5BC4C8
MKAIIDIKPDPRLDGLDVYVVGGAVRDALLGLPCGDRDWVVVGSTPEALQARGFVAVGADFPVFLHPQTKEEFALARTERKSGRGYKGFTFYAGTDVTLEQDLARRDLTINAMAQSPDGVVVDPYGGQQDLQQSVLRHVGVAFGEDPVRILRLARFTARFTQFNVAPETMALCRQMVEQGEVDHLVPERVWQEIVRGLRAEKPARMFEVLRACGALPVIMPSLVYDEELGAQLDEVRRILSPDLPAIYALLLHRTSDRDALSRRIRATTECAQWARLLPQILTEMAQTHLAYPCDEQTVHQLLSLIEKADGFRRVDRFLDLISLAAWLRGQAAQPWISALEAAREVDAGAIASGLQGQGGPAIAQAVRQARLAAISQQMSSIPAHESNQ